MLEQISKLSPLAILGTIFAVLAITSIAAALAMIAHPLLGAFAFFFLAALLCAVIAESVSFVKPI